MILYYSVASVFSCSPLLQTPAYATTHHNIYVYINTTYIHSKHYVLRSTLLDYVFSCVRWCSTPTHEHQLLLYYSLLFRVPCRKKAPAAISPLNKRLRFFVIVCPPTENRRSAAADNACTARYLRADLVTVANACFAFLPTT